MAQTYVSPHASVHPTAYIGRGVTILGPAEVHEGVVVEDYATIGKPSFPELEQLRNTAVVNPDFSHYDNAVKQPTVIHRNCLIGKNASVYSGSVLHEGVECEDNTRVGWNAEIGARSHVVYAGLIYCRVKTGIECRIAGFVGNDTILGDYVSFYGQAVHKYRIFETEDRPTPAPVIQNRAVVGAGAVIVGGVLIGEEAYVAAGATVTKEVLPQHTVTGFNDSVPPKRWKGDGMKKFISHWQKLGISSK